MPGTRIQNPTNELRVTPPLLLGAVLFRRRRNQKHSFFLLTTVAAKRRPLGFRLIDLVLTPYLNWMCLRRSSGGSTS